jgi:uncharacterized protein YkwD
MRALPGRRGFALAITVASLLVPSAGQADATPRCGWYGKSPGEASNHELRSSTLCLVNQIRERHGIPPLDFNLALRQSASAHSANMVRSRSLSHYGPGGSTLTTRVARAGYLGDMSGFRAAENIGAGQGSFGSPFAIVRSWMQSPGHRRNILDRGLRDFGVGVARGNPLGRSGNAATYTIDFGARWR